MKSIRKQIHNNVIALVSIFVAITALTYNTWRNETTEEQRNIRHAAFRVLENLGDLQAVVDSRYYYLPFNKEIGSEGELRIRGFSNVSMVHDLMMLMPAQASDAGNTLFKTWQQRFNSLNQLDQSGQHTPAAKQAEHELTRAIGDARNAVMDVLRKLD